MKHFVCVFPLKRDLGTSFVIIVGSHGGRKMEARYLLRVGTAVNASAAVASTVSTKDEVSRWWLVHLQRPQQGISERGSRVRNSQMNRGPLRLTRATLDAPPVAPDLSGPWGAAAYTEASGCWLQVIGQLKSCDVEMQKNVSILFLWHISIWKRWWRLQMRA